MCANRNKYEQTYSYKYLLSKYDLGDCGLWEISGEDPNPDLTGSHHMPIIGHVEGELNDVINYAVNLSGFWQWGGGGKISKIKYKIL